MKLKDIVVLKNNEFRFAAGCAKVCNGCGGCDVHVVRVFDNYAGGVPFLVIK